MKFRKLICVVLAAALLFMCGCGYNPATVGTVGGRDITCGEYLLSQFYAASTAYQDSGLSSFDSFLSGSDADGVAYTDSVRESTLQTLRENSFVLSEFDRLGLELDSWTQYSSEYYAQYYWSNYYSTVMESNGIGYDSYLAYNEITTKSSLLFDAYYGEGGEMEVPLSDVMAYYDANYANVSYLNIPQTDANGEAVTDEMRTKEVELCQQIADAVNAGTPFAEAALEPYNAIKALLGYSEDTYYTADTMTEAISAAANITNDGTYDEAFVQQAIANKNGAYVYDGESTLYVYLRGNCYADEEDFKTNCYSDGLAGLKQDDFNAYLAEKSADTEMALSDKAMKHYSVKNVTVS